MTAVPQLLDRNQEFAKNFNDAELPILPKLRCVIVACVDARVDPAHILDLPLGEAVVMRNNGGRVTDEIIDEIAALAFMAANLDGEIPGPFEVIIMEHTHCGAERFADPGFQAVAKAHLGIDVSKTAINDHRQCLTSDLEKLEAAKNIPDYVQVSSLLYDLKTGLVEQVSAPKAIR